MATLWLSLPELSTADNDRHGYTHVANDQSYQRLHARKQGWDALP